MKLILEEPLGVGPLISAQLPPDRDHASIFTKRTLSCRYKYSTVE
jgi:hypothetical protein